jgi:hypothetical protein
MTDVSAPELPERQGPFANLRKAMTGFVLITFTALTGISCLIVLSSTLMQGRMSSIAVNGVPLSIWKVEDMRRQWAEVRQVVGILSQSVTEAERSRASHTSVAARVEGEYRAKRQALIIRLDEMQLRLRALDPQSADKIESGREDPSQRFINISILRSRLLTDHPELTPLYDELESAFRDYGRARDNYSAARSAGEAIIQQIKTLQDATMGSAQTLDTLFSQISPGAKLDESTRSRVETALYEFISISGLLGILNRGLVTTNPDTLTLILVIMMGILGSSLQMTYALLRQHRLETLGTYCLRLCVGAITALIIFIVAKAGVPIIADASRLGGDAAINPYFVSFLAIISGLMSENAILSVQTQGARFFGAEGATEPKRWARQDLRKPFEAANRDPERVKRLLQASDDEFEGWVSGKEPIPPNVQMIIAGVLQTPPRDLFTDIPPDQAGTTS